MMMGGNQSMSKDAFVSPDLVNDAYVDNIKAKLQILDQI